MPLYEYRCPECGEFEAWRTIANRDQAPACPDCDGPSARIFAAPMVNLNTGNLGRFTGNSEPKLVTRQREANQPRYQPSRCDRPWMLGPRQVLGTFIPKISPTATGASWN